MASTQSKKRYLHALVGGFITGVLIMTLLMPRSMFQSKVVAKRSTQDKLFSHGIVDKDKLAANLKRVKQREQSLDVRGVVELNRLKQGQNDLEASQVVAGRLMQSLGHGTSITRHPAHRKLEDVRGHLGMSQIVHGASALSRTTVTHSTRSTPSTSSSTTSSTTPSTTTTSSTTRPTTTTSSTVTTTRSTTTTVPRPPAPVPQLPSYNKTIS